MIRYIYIIAFSFILIITNYSCTPMQTLSYQYGDGSGNQYIITSDSIEYLPVKKEFSSSGMYDGGDYTKNKITSENFQKLTDEIHLLFENKSLHIKDRIKTSGIITVMKDSKEDKTIIIKNSPEKERFETLLKNLKK